MACRWFLGFLLILSWGCKLQAAQTVLAVPFFNQTNSSNLDWIGESIAEEMRESLDAQGVLALDREERLEAFRRLSLRPNAVLTHASLIKAGESLDATDVIYGHYELEQATEAGRGTLHITARILNLKRLKQGPEFSESGALEDLAVLEARLSWQALDFLSPKSAPPEEAFLRARPKVRLNALESYIRGLMADDPEQRQHFFTQAARLDEGYSQPCFQLGRWDFQKKDYRAAATWLARVTPGDTHYLEAEFFLGLSKYLLGDYAGAERCFQQVAAAIPLNEVYNNLGAAQSRLHLPSAIDSFRKAVEGDNTDPAYHFNLGYALWKAGQFDAAAESLSAALERNPDDEEAATLLDRAKRREPAHPGSQARERLKTNYEETAYRQLEAELGAKKD
jgi:tetratricopeptide (TPR) repeat protein